MEASMNLPVCGLAASGVPISQNQTIPEVLRAWPQLRLVLDKYGLKGCGGPLGPEESIEFFARAHGVDSSKLLRELNEMCGQTSTQSPPVYQPGLGDTIYRNFFLGAISVLLSAGAVWGALLLLKIGFAQDFTINSIFAVNAHGHAMIFGWVGLFVMGFAYQAFPRFKHVELHRPRLAVATFWMMFAGISARALCETLHERSSWLWAGAMLACTLEVAAILIFVWLLVATYRKSGKSVETYDKYVFAALGFFVLQAFGDAVLLTATTTAPTDAALLERIKTLQAPLRDLQIHGFAVLMILGVSLRLLPTVYGIAAEDGRKADRVLIPIAAAVLAEAGFYLLNARSPGTAWAPAGLYASMLAYAGLVTWLVGSMRVFVADKQTDRSVKFIKAAYTWLLISLAMLIVMPAYLGWYRGATGSGFSHAYYGATRHAITVGFISMMILGVSAKVVPTLCGISSARLGELWPTFVLVNTGCALRVAFQVLTDVEGLKEFAHPVAGISGVLEVTGMGFWAVHMCYLLLGTRVGSAAEPEREPNLSLPRIEAASKVGSVIALFPQTLNVFLNHGFTLLANAYMRDTLARTVSIQQACEIHKVDLEALLRDLNRVVAARPPNAEQASLSRGKRLEDGLAQPL